MKISAFLQSVNNNIKANPTQTPKESTVSESLITDYKTTASKDVQSIFDKYAFKPTQEQLGQVSTFMNQAKGTEAQKLQTLDVALYKGIEPTVDNLSTIHQALTHDSEVVKSLVDAPIALEGEMTEASLVKTIESMKLPEAVKAALKRQVAEGVPLKEAIREIVNLINEKFPGSISIKNNASVGEMLKAIQNFTTNNSEKALLFLNSDVKIPAQVEANSQTERRSHVRLSAEKISGAEKNINLSAEVVSEQTSKGHAPTLTKESHEEGSPEKIVLTTNVSESVAKVPNASQTNETMVDASSDSIVETSDNLTSDNLTSDQSIESMVESMVESMIEAMVENMDAVFSSISESMNLKTFLVESTTEATIRAKNTFENFKAETVKLLQATVLPQNTAQMTANITKAIEKLNHIILKSDVTLYTDMFTEKKLLVMASELEKAQGYVKQGELGKAHEVVKAATSLLEQIRFNPSQRRIQVFAQNKLEKLEKVFEGQEKATQKLEHQILKQVESSRDGQGSRMAREILETLRFLGLNHEMEVAESLEGVDDETQKDWANGNVKEILLKLMKEDAKDRSVEATEQNLMNFSGQQMMNDTGSGQPPFYFFNLPIMDGEELGNMKVYMKGASKNHQIDWKNAELYFGVTLKNTGSVGIKVKIQQEKVNFEVLSDTDTGLNTKLAQVLDELESIGFEKGEVISKRFSEDNGIVLKPVLEMPQSKMTPVTDGKGFDFKI